MSTQPPGWRARRPDGSSPTRKPANLMLARSGVKVLDFGLAKLRDCHDDLTGSGVALGTVAYMSPEQATGAPVDARTDVWALGVVLYEMLAGRRPFQGEHSPAVSWAIVHGDPPPLSGIPPALSRIEAWIAWRGGDPASARASAREAVAIWSQFPAGHASTAFVWGALLPQIAAAREAQDLAEAAACARALLEGSSMELPAALIDAATGATRAWDRGDAPDAGQHLDRVIEVARQSRLL